MCLKVMRMGGDMMLSGFWLFMVKFASFICVANFVLEVLVATAKQFDKNGE